jgi:WD40 repeat protein
MTHIDLSTINFAVVHNAAAAVWLLSDLGPVVTPTLPALSWRMCRERNGSHMNYRIFLSYGHDEHFELARKLKRDIEARGHEVWIDEEHLSPGTDWETGIEQGLDWAASDPARGRVILLMTPHSVRRPDGYCLNELARAISRGLQIVPIMVVWVEPPLSICRIQWLDLRDCIPLDSRPAAYETKLDQLIAAIEQKRPDFEGVQARLMALLDPLPFDGEINEHLASFTGRDWLFAKIDHWLADPAAEKIFWITGPPGIGKTALAAKLVATRPQVVAAHFCSFGHTQKSDARRGVLSIAYQLSTQLPEYQARLNALPLQMIIAESDARTLFDRLILQPLLANFPDPQRTLVVLIDALDEATQERRNPLASFLAVEFPRTPSWLRLVITSRPDPEVMYPMQAITAEVIDAASSENEADIRSFLQHALKSHLLDTRNADVVVDHIVQLSEGNFLYANWVRKEIIAGRLSLAEPDALPKGLGGIYSQFAARQWQDINAFKGHAAAALDVIAAAREPLKLSLLSTIFGWSERQQNDFENALGSLFTFTDSRVVPFHKSLLDWLTDRSKAGPYFVSAADGNRRLTDFCWGQFSANPPSLSDYAVHHLPAHLIADKRWNQLETVLTTLSFLEAKAEGARIFDLASDFARALETLPPGRPIGRIIHLLDQAIRRELHFIGRHPTTLFQCLWNLCWWFDCPEAAHRYDVSAQDGNQRATPPWLAFGPKLYELLEMWRKEKEAQTPNFVWVRSLRPPALPLGIGHMVLGGHTDTILAVSVSADGGRLVSGSADSTVRLWDTQSGAERLHCKASGGAKAVAISGDGRFIAARPYVSKSVAIWDASTGKVVKLVGPHTNDINCIAISPDGRFLAAGSSDATTLVWEISSAEQIAVLRGTSNRLDEKIEVSQIESVQFSPDGTLLLVGDRDLSRRRSQCIRLWNWRSDKEIRCIGAFTTLVHSVCFSPDGRRFAASAGDVTGEYLIKIWDLEGDGPLVLAGHTDTVNDIGFSPDGTRLVSGSSDETVRIWDATTGALLHEIEVGNKVNCVGYLSDGRRIYSAGYDKAVRIWDSISAATSTLNRPDSADNLWRLAYSPDGKVLATGSEHGAVEIWDAHTGRSRGCCRPWVRGPVNNMVFSPDSRHVAVATGHVPWDDPPDPWEGRSDFDVRIYDLGNGSVVGILKLSQKIEPRMLRYSADGKNIIAPLDGGPITIWDSERFCKLDEFSGVLHDGIFSLDQETRERLLASFRATNENSKKMLAELFSGSKLPKGAVGGADMIRAQRFAASSYTFSPTASIASAGITAYLQGAETVFTDTNGRDIAWFSQPLFDLMEHPGGRMWAGSSEGVHAYQNDARRVDMVAIEGETGVKPLSYPA